MRRPDAPASPYLATLVSLTLPAGLYLAGSGYVYRTRRVGTALGGYDTPADTAPVAYVAAPAPLGYVAYGLTPNAYVPLTGLTYASAIEVTLGALYGVGVTPPRTPRALRAAARRVNR